MTAVSGTGAGTVGGTTAGTYGSLTLNGNGSYTYTLNNGTNGTASLVQPIILPIHGARSSLTLLAQMVGETETSDRKLVEATWVGK